jgi:hopanoid biosynthesis associated RND transporter like protein HpnN
LSRSEDVLGAALARWVAFSVRHGRVVAALVLVVSLAAGAYASRNLGFNTNPNDLFDADLSFQRMIRTFEEHFPQLTDSLIVVVDGETAEQVHETAEALAARLRQRTEHFTDVYFPGEEAFFEAHGLLYQSADELDDFVERLATLQPMIATLTRDPTLATLAWAVRTGLEQSPKGEEEVARLRSVLDHFREAAIAVYAEYPLYVPWESALLGGTAFDPETRRVIVAVPVLHFGRILAADPAISSIRREVEALSPRDVRVRITGYPALNHEEFLGLARDTSVAGVLSFLLVVLVLWFAFRSSRLVWAAALTLVSGVLWTAAYAAVFVGELNPASIAFAVLFIGLGVDFTIHLGMHLTAAVRDGASVDQGLHRATRSTGSALVLCAVTTSIGFLAFLPTQYKGVSELGVISAGGMLVIVFQTLTLFPVLASWWLRGAALARLRERRPLVVPLRAPGRPLAVCIGAAALGLAGVLLVPRVAIETNVVALRNPQTESVQAFMDLLSSDNISPWYADLLAEDLDAAKALAERARALAVVEHAVTIADYVPADQEEKLEILADAVLFMDLPPGGAVQRGETSLEEQLQALKDLVVFLGARSLESSGGGLARSGRLLRGELAGLLLRIDRDDDPAAAIAALEESLLGKVPALTERLSASLETSGISFEDLPPDLVRRMLAEDGTARVQVFPAEDLAERETMVRFVESLREVTPDLTGLPVNLVATSYVTRDSLREALLFSLAAIAALLVLLWGRPVEATIALTPLMLAIVLTAACTQIFDISFNFINVCVLPLLLGIGVDSGVHMVHRAREIPVASGRLLTSTTTQAVLFSSLTTLASFGTLVLSDHRGIASLGELLVLGMGFTLAGNLLLLPSLLMLWQGVRQSPAEGDA